jgi:hypothetical protein
MARLATRRAGGRHAQPCWAATWLVGKAGVGGIRSGVARQVARVMSIASPRSLSGVGPSDPGRASTLSCQFGLACLVPAGRRREHSTWVGCGQGHWVQVPPAGRPSLPGIDLLLLVASISGGPQHLALGRGRRSKWSSIGAQLVQPGERQLYLPTSTGDTRHSTARRLLHQVVQQGRLAHARLARTTSARLDNVSLLGTVGTAGVGCVPWSPSRWSQPAAARQAALSSRPGAGGRSAPAQARA